MSLAMGISRFGFTPIIPLMQRDIGVTEWDIAVMASANYLGYLIGAYISRKQWIRKQLRIWLGGGIVTSIILLIAMPLTLNDLLWSFLRMLSGFLSAILFVVASSITLGQGRSDWAGYLYSGVGLGIAFTGLFVPLFDSIGGWAAAWQGLALGGSIFGIVAWYTLSKASFPEAGEQGEIRSQDKFKRDYEWYVLLISYGLEGIGYIITATFIVQMIKSMPELSHIANQSWILIGLAAAPSTYLWAQIAKKTSLKLSLMLAYGVQALGILLPVIIPNQVSTLAGGALFGGTFMGITSLTITLASRVKPKAQLQAIGELTTVYALGQIIGPVVAAYLQKNVNIAAPSLFAAVMLILALLVLMTPKIIKFRKI
ncbi:YbfB/YjiJ family MFS transporter [Pelosinus propionicus]|uniref:Predicted arabinose efflux permease, MFS family n=1 Tax=Pelosinus propionicus DSM 13327 TaxID=1123291 RepID=A0A1I4PIY6_9FIRM|nr:YbfB/YjiJ family MFS transporter [Pelosinus propionicus]SFM27516.1 Predicted arabinose efflux permease, MFS family [Pelosinus propionicus DSM 13327]